MVRVLDVQAIVVAVVTRLTVDILREEILTGDVFERKFGFIAEDVGSIAERGGRGA